MAYLSDPDVSEQSFIPPDKTVARPDVLRHFRQYT